MAIYIPLVHIQEKVGAKPAGLQNKLGLIGTDLMIKIIIIVNAMDIKNIKI
jgi:hypothetical protein